MTLTSPLLSIAVGAVAGMLAVSQANSETPSPAEARAIAAEAYLYAYPMLYEYKTMFQQAADPSFPGFAGGFNRFRHYSRGATPADTDIVSPNNDTPYSDSPASRVARDWRRSILQ